MGAAASVRHLYKEALDWFKVYIDSETYEADFKLMDKNEDGLISLMELQKFIGDKCAEDKGWEVLNDGQVLVNAHRNAAQFEHVQGANKKDVNLGEFKALLVHLFAAALLHAHFNNADTWEDIVDIDGNNKKPMKLNFEKYRLACKTFCQAHAGEDLSEAQIKEDFDYLDKNGFGYIGFTEICNHCCHFINPNYTPKDSNHELPKTPSNNNDDDSKKLTSKRVVPKFFGEFKGEISTEDVVNELHKGPKVYYASATVNQKNNEAMNQLNKKLQRDSAQAQQLAKSTKSLLAIEEETALLSNAPVTMRAILEYEKSNTAFSEFMRSEFAYENVQYFMEMEGIKQARRMLLDRATLLHETYIKHGAPAEVNISDKMKSDIAMILTKQFQEIYPKDLLMVTLQEAQDEIVSIMAKGPLHRFLSSPFYRNWRLADKTNASEMMANVAEKIRAMGATPKSDKQSAAFEPTNDGMLSQSESVEALERNL